VGTNLMKGSFSSRLVDPLAINADIIHLRLLVLRSFSLGADLTEFDDLINLVLHSTLAGSKILRLRRKLG
jgi:hypothetical protein